MAMATASLLLLTISLFLSLAQAIPAIIQPNTEDPSTVFSQTSDYPLPNLGNIQAHDPNILEYNNNFYLYKGGVHIPIYKAANLSGPWEPVGTVLDGPSTMEKENRTRPWAPTTVSWKGRFYCFYALSEPGVRNSAIGVASTGSIEGTGGAGSWTDHGALINTERGPLSHIYPYTVSNAIDAAFSVDQKTGQPYLLYGSYWWGIFQLPLTEDLLSVVDKEHPDAKHLAYLPDPKVKRQEGPWMSYREPYYYLWFSHGKCCGFQKGFPVKGNEYSIRVGRSKDISGPFLDKSGRKLIHSGGTVVYGSNHGEVYAPGGIGVLPENDKHQDVLYYHYLNTSIGFLDKEAQLGYSYLEYDDGWPIASATSSKSNNGNSSRQASTINLVFLMSMCCLILYALRKHLTIARLMFSVLLVLVAWAVSWGS